MMMMILMVITVTTTITKQQKNNKSESSLREVTRFENDVLEEHAVSIFIVKEIWFMLMLK
jgi:hypothetical protein